MKYLLKEFNQLSVQELFAIYKLRSKVFVVEQNCAYQDVDEKDLKAVHLMIFETGTLVAYCRIVPPHGSYIEPSIGRVVVDSDYRNKKYGELLMKYSIKHTLELFRNQEIVISAQSYLINFYTRLGFIAEGKEYLEDDIPHIKMRYL